MPIDLLDTISLRVDQGGVDKELTLSRSRKWINCGESPPCTQKNLPSTKPAIGRAQNERMHAS